MQVWQFSKCIQTCIVTERRSQVIEQYECTHTYSFTSHNKKMKMHSAKRRGRKKGETFYRKQETNAQKWKLKKKVIEITVIMTINSESVQAIETSFCWCQNVDMHAQCTVQVLLQIFIQLYSSIFIECTE